MFLVGPSFAGVPGAADAAVLASLRTAVLAVSAVALGTLAGRTGLREALWLLYPLLVLGGIKLILEDFQNGRAETLFIGLACYGCALIIAPRLARPRGGSDTARNPPIVGMENPIEPDSKAPKVTNSANGIPESPAPPPSLG